MPESKITAVLGPTNTGKTHLAVERMCAHSSGMMGFPLRLLAREIYDRVVKIKGKNQVALITGEERIMPRDARWLLCTTESIPMERDVAFLAIDEVQLGTDPERGHIFTDRLLNARGREETMLLGSESLRPVIRSLLPEAEIITRPRFSKLTYAPPKKLSRLPPRSAIVAFSVEEVYAIAEMLRQSRGGAAVVMGALSPRTRNAQVKMYQDGEVDYLVATDAIGMGLNMDVSSVYFANLSKFDGRRQRRLTIAEMAQIAGRAGRHQRDGQFGTLAGGIMFTPDEIERIENHQFPKIDGLYWRSGEPDYSSLAALIASLETTPQHRMLRAAPEASDLVILKILASEPDIAARVRSPADAARLWDVCRLPDFQKLGPEFHARFVSRVFTYLSSAERFFPDHMFADQLARLDSVQGDVPAVAARIAVARTWAYIAQRADWLGNPEKWRARAAELEEKLSDALHAKLTERFVDKRTKMLLRGASSATTLLDVHVEPDGAVMVEDQRIGQLDGFRFSTDPLATSVDRKRLITAAEKHLARELSARADALALATDRDICLTTTMGSPVAISWRGFEVARLDRGKALLLPKVRIDSAIQKLEPMRVGAIQARLTNWLDTKINFQLPVFSSLAAIIANEATSPGLRSLLARLIDAGGIIDRNEIEEILMLLDPADRQILKHRGIVLASLDVFHPALIKPEATRWRLALDAARTGAPMPPLPLPGLGLLDQPATELAAAAQKAGFRRFGTQWLRIDLLEKIARKVHDQRSGRLPFVPDHQFATGIGIGEVTLGHIMRALGFTPAKSDVETTATWQWRGIKRKRPQAAAVPHSPFAGLRALQDIAQPARQG